jgi:hypothetical protein
MRRVIDELGISAVEFLKPFKLAGKLCADH